MTTPAASSPRTLDRVFPALQTLEGGGVSIRRAFPQSQIDHLDPFLLLDEMGPFEVAPGRAVGFPDHPHRGFETVTYLLSGQMSHRDSRGNSGNIEAGGVQWMTAGSGLVHSEMPGDDLVRTGGRLHGFQLWVNLPRQFKMAEPRYQELGPAAIPAARNQAGDVRVKVIAGESLGQAGAVQTHTPILYLHFHLDPGAAHSQAAPASLNAFAYVIAGEMNEDVKAGEIAVFANNGETIDIRNSGSEPLELLLIGGAPLSEPVARWGPFVMNTQAEVRQAFADFQAGKMGSIAPAQRPL